MPTITTCARSRCIKVALEAGETSRPIYVPPSSSFVVTAAPGSGGTMLVEVTWSPASDVGLDTARWFPWDAGAATAKAYQLIAHATAVRFTATGAAGVGEVAR